MVGPTFVGGLAAEFSPVNKLLPQTVIVINRGSNCAAAESVISPTIKVSAISWMDESRATSSWASFCARRMLGFGSVPSHSRPFAERFEQYEESYSPVTA
jgi:hypothetical protein